MSWMISKSAYQNCILNLSQTSGGTREDTVLEDDELFVCFVLKPVCLIVNCVSLMVDHVCLMLNRVCLMNHACLLVNHNVFDGELCMLPVLDGEVCV